ncbi:hypothetical protein [Streptomyces davaonensis]|nr:hypothetical protein [Streptomyces davaonensis]
MGAVAVTGVVVGVLGGCSGGEEEPQGGASGASVSSSASASASVSSAPPTTPGGVLDAAEEAMRGESGWTFAVEGEEGLDLSGGGSEATYSATVQRTGKPEALHASGTVVSKGSSTPEEVFVVDGVGHVREGDGAWESGDVSDPEIANKVEDPVDALDVFRAYAEGGERIDVAREGGDITLRVEVPSGKLSDERPALAKAVREVRPTIEQLREGGVTATDSEIALTRLTDVLVLDGDSYRIKSHRFSFGFTIPYQGQQITYRQEVEEANRGVFAGDITLPDSVA